MRICSLASGSMGNCIYVDSGSVRILVDVGISFKSLKERASAMSIDLSQLDAILITHEHGDHIKGLMRTAKTLNIPCYCHPKCKSKVITDETIPYYGDIADYENGFSIGNAEIVPFRTPHDSVFSVGYKVKSEGKSISIATDLGVVTKGVYDNIAHSDVVFLESNHDINMLKHSHYPLPLINRILGNNGHLSNLECAATVRKLFESGTSKFILGHISQENNLESIAFGQTNNELMNLRAENYTLEVATQSSPTKIIEVKNG